MIPKIDSNIWVSNFGKLNHNKLWLFNLRHMVYYFTFGFNNYNMYFIIIYDDLQSYP